MYRVKRIPDDKSRARCVHHICSRYFRFEKADQRTASVTGIYPHV